MTRTGNPAERAGQAAKTARRLRRERERVAGWASAALLAIPLLFAAVWTRTEVARELRVRDELYARRDSLECTLLRLDWKKSRLSGWEQVEARLAGNGLRAPRPDEVIWVPVEDRHGKGGLRRW